MPLDKCRSGGGNGNDEVGPVLAEQGGQVVGEWGVIGIAGKPCRFQRGLEQVDLVWQLSGQFHAEMLRILTPRWSIQTEGMQQQDALWGCGSGIETKRKKKQCDREATGNDTHPRRET